jgi:hypothetical protein
MIRLLAALLTLAVASTAFADDKDKPKPNTLTPKEIAEGWILLFDGESTFGWGKEGNPQVKDGNLVFSAGEKEIEFWYPVGFPDEFDLVAEWYRVGRSHYRCSNLVTSTNLLPVKEHAKGQHRCYRSDRGFVSDWQFWIADDMPTGLATSTSNGDPMTARIGFKLEANSSVVIRSLKLRPRKTKPLFTGKNLDGWKINAADPKRMASKWEVTKDGELSVKNGPGDLVTDKEFDNFVLQFECKTNGKALNSGFFFRCIPGQYQNGYEAQIQNAYKDDDRTKPADFGTGAIYRRIAARKVVSNDNEWFTMTVVADGKHISTWVNGYQTVDWIDDRKENENPRQGFRAAKGPISIQGHDPTTDILFRNIRIAELPSK